MIAAALGVLTSRAGLVAIVVAMAFAWHRYELADARDGWVQEFELEAVTAERDALRRKAVAAAVANQQLSERMQVAEAEAARIAEELEAYENETVINPDGLVDRSLLQRLRAN